MSGFTRDPLHYGDELVYEALQGKWRRYHQYCGCGQDWVEAHAIPAGFRVVRRRPGFVALVGPGLTEGVDEERLTTNALWEAVVGAPGGQDWFEQVHVFERSPEELDRSAPRRQPARDPERRDWEAKARKEPVTEAQARYLASLASKISRERFDELYAAAAQRSGIEQRQPEEKTAAMIARLTKATARQLITSLVEGR